MECGKIFQDSILKACLLKLPSTLRNELSLEILFQLFSQVVLFSSTYTEKAQQINKINLDC